MTHKLSHDEQRLLSEDEARAYQAWFVMQMEAADRRESKRRHKDVNADELQWDYDRSGGTWQNYETGE